MEQPQEKGLLSRLLGPVDVNTQVGINQKDIATTGAILFILVCLIFGAWYAFKKLV